MTVLDGPTTMALVSLLYGVMPVLVWLVLPRQGKPDVDLWCLAGLMPALGVLLLVLQPQLPTPVGFHLANTMVLGGPLCVVQSLRLTLGQGWSAAGWGLRMGWALLFYSALYAGSTDEMRGPLFRLGLGLLSLYAATWSWRLHRRMCSANAAVITLALLMVGLAYVGHSLWMLGWPAQPHPFSRIWDASGISLVALLAMVVINLSYVGMVLDLVARDRLQALQAQQAAQQTQWLDAQLLDLERRRRMAMVSGTLAHELTQPLTAASVNAQMAERQWRQDPMATELLRSLLKQVEVGVLRTVQILERIRAGRDLSTQHHRRLDLQQVLAQALEQMAPQCHRLGVTLAPVHGARSVWCLGDEVGLSQVLVNLLRNALQAMEGQTLRLLTVNCMAQDGHALLRVRDSGPGMSAQQLACWGEPFASTREEGLGLGLAISRDIVNSHGGQLALRQLPQGGMEAVVRLPLAEGAG